MEVLSSRVLLRPTDLPRSRRFYAETLGLAIYREFGDGDERGTVFFLGGGFLEVSGQSSEPPGRAVQLWLQVRSIDDMKAQFEAAGVLIARQPRLEPWGLREMWIHDPDGIPIVVVEVPEDHPLRRR